MVAMTAGMCSENDEIELGLRMREGGHGAAFLYTGATRLAVAADVSAGQHECMQYSVDGL
jgi:hypothetical protein